MTTAPTKHRLSTYCVLGRYGLELAETWRSQTSLDRRGACPRPPRGCQAEADLERLPPRRPAFLERHPVGRPWDDQQQELRAFRTGPGPVFTLSRCERQLPTGCPPNPVSPRGGGAQSACWLPLPLVLSREHCPEKCRDEGGVTQRVKGSKELSVC